MNTKPLPESVFETYISTLSQQRNIFVRCRYPSVVISEQILQHSGYGLREDASGL